MFELLIVKPLFNLLALIYALLPGHNFGLALIIFTVLIRFMMLPLLKKQLYHAKAMREMQPELKKIKQASKGDKQKESQLVMELYRERQIKPLAPIGLLIVQFIVLIGLYSGLKRVIEHPEAIINFSYGWIHNLPWMQTLSQDISKFDATLFGVIDLTKSAIGKDGVWYIPGLMLVIGSAFSQYLSSSQLLPKSKDGRTLKHILKEATNGKQTEQAEVQMAVGRTTKYIIPFAILFLTVGLASALNLYWFVGGMVAYYQQGRILKKDETELEEIADKSTKTIIEGEIIEKPTATQRTKTSSKKAQSKKRRKR